MLVVKFEPLSFLDGCLKSMRVCILACKCQFLNPFSTNPTKCSNTPKQFVGNNKGDVDLLLADCIDLCVQGGVNKKMGLISLPSRMVKYQGNERMSNFCS